MLLFHYGSDTRRLVEAGTALIVQYRAKFGASCNLFVLDATASDALQEVERVLKYPSFFEEKKFVILKNPSVRAHEISDILRQYTIGGLEDTVLLLQDRNDGEILQKKHKELMSSARSEGAVFSAFEPLTATRAHAWVQEQAKARGCSLSPEAAKLLYRSVGADSWALSSETAKLCAYQRSGIIDTDAVQALVPQMAEENVFELLDALAEKDKRAGLSHLYRHLSSGADPMYLLAMFAYQIRNLCIVRNLADRGMSASAISKRAGLHPFVVQKALRGARAFSADELTRALTELADVDRATKQGIVDPADALYGFFLSLGQPVRT